MTELLTSLHVDWHILLAQIANFLILLFLLSKFAYKPVIKLLNERRKMVEDSVERSQAIEQKFQEFQEYRAKQLQEVRKEAQQILLTAHESAEKEKEEILAKTRTQLDVLFARAEKQIEQQKVEMVAKAEKEIVTLLIPSLTRVLKDSVDEQTQKSILDQAAKRIKTMYS